jgi:peptidoglycan hydrolase FlgJ
MTKPIDPSASLAADVQSLASLKLAAKGAQPSPDTLKKVASQFEALFMNMMLKSMREASLGDDVFGSDSGNFYRDMYDQQLSMSLAKNQGMGLTNILVKQLGGEKSSPAPGIDGSAGIALHPDRKAFPLNTLRPAMPLPQATSPTAFVKSLWPQAQNAAEKLGVAPEALLSIAALETGWGQSVISHADGRLSNNLFGIKADKNWGGAQVSVPTVEYQGGLASNQQAAFRSYDSVAQSFDDFVNFVRTNPRYQSALAQGADPQAFVAALQQNGYATDPAYAQKLSAILKGDTLRSALNGLKFPGNRPIPA